MPRSLRKPTRRWRPDAVRIPLHLPVDDYSPAMCRVRLNLGIAMAQLNPNGFRRARTGRHKKRPNLKVTRIDYLNDMVRLGRGAVMASLERAKAKKYSRVDV
jgi:hypothetical protein